MTTFAPTKINNNNLKIRAMKQTINVSSKAEVVAAVTSDLVEVITISKVTFVRVILEHM